MNNIESDLPFEPCEPSFKSFEFSESIFGIEIGVRILKAEGSLFIWVGSNKENRMSDLSLAFITRFQSMPLSTQLLGSSTDAISTGLATKLSKKLGRQIIMSCNITDRHMLPEVEKLLFSKIASDKEIFS